MTEKSDSIVLVPGNTDANLPYKRFSFWNCVPRIPHPPSKEVFEVQAQLSLIFQSLGGKKMNIKLHSLIFDWKVFSNANSIKWLLRY